MLHGTLPAALQLPACHSSIHRVSYAESSFGDMTVDVEMWLGQALQERTCCTSMGAATSWLHNDGNGGCPSLLRPTIQLGYRWRHWPWFQAYDALCEQQQGHIAHQLGVRLYKQGATF